MYSETELEELREKYRWYSELLSEANGFSTFFAI